MKCPRCQHENPADAAFCQECGTRLEAACPSCGTANQLGAKFCKKCGQPVAMTATAAAGASKFTSPESYTPKHLAEKILTSKGALEGERKQVTVLFADMKGSMELLADRDPEEARKILDPVLERMMEAVHRYEGTVNQVMGDGIMALFGAPLAHEDHAVRACYAALRMQDRVRRYSEELRRSEGLEVQIRIGLNSGEVVVRSISGDLHIDYTAVGQTTHLAARMEQLATPGTVRLTAETLRFAEGFVQVRPLGPIPVKGVAEPVEIFELVGAAAVRTRLQAARARGFSRFVGRDAEMDQLRQAAEQSRRGRGQVVAVVGEPGVGKSRLFYEFIHSHRTHDWLVLEAGSVSYGKATPFLPLADTLRAYFRIDDRDDTRSVRAKVTGTLLTLDRALEDVVSAVLWLLDALGPDDAFLALEPAQRRQRALDGVKRLLLRESQVQPLLLVFEDLHWIDAETQRVLDSLVESLPTAHILLAVNYRPEYRHGWGNKTYYRQARIDPLPPESADELLRTLLGEDRSVEPLTPLLIERTEGNPLFLEESVRTLVETHVLAGEPGAYRLTGPVGAVQMPPTVQAILAARIDRLGPELKRLLQAASVVGKDVPVVLLEAIAEMADDELRRSLAELQTAEFLYEARLFPDLEYTFKHALTHEVAYGSLLQDRRRALHAALVEAVETRYADRLAEQVEVLAHHTVRGGLAIKAARYLRQAGAKAVARSANREAVAFFEQALSALAELPESREALTEALDIRLDLGPALISTAGGGSSQVYAAYTRARELSDQVGDSSRLFQVLWGLWYSSLNRGEYRATRELGEKLLVAARDAGDSTLLLEAHHSLWATRFQLGELSAAMPHLDEGLRLYDPRRHGALAFRYAGHDAGVCGHSHLSLTLWALGYPDQAARCSEEALSLARELGHPHSTVIAHFWAAALREHRGEHLAGARLAGVAAELASAHGVAVFRGQASALLGLLQVGQGQGDDLLARIEHAHALARGEGSRWRDAWLLGRLASAYGKAGDIGKGLETLAEMSARVQSPNFSEPELHRLRGELLLHLPGANSGEAEAAFRRAVEVARARGQKSLELRAVTGLARLLDREGRRDEARRMLADIYGWFTEGFDTADLKTAKTLLDELSSASV